MSSAPQLVGHVDDRDDIIEGLREKNRRLDEALRTERNKVGQSEAGVKELRRVLTPLYRALQTVFGEMDAMGIEDAGSSTPNIANGDNPRWQSFKQAYPGAPAQIIDALMVHREMGITQLAALLKIHYNTAQTALDKLAKAGAVTKDGTRNGKYSLKP